MSVQKQTVLITGASTGIGKEAALYFQKQGWNVVATMRNPSKETQLSALENTICERLDVTDTASIRSAIETSLKKFGKIDAVVNNAGYGLTGPFEGATPEQIQRQYDTNVFGLMSVTREILPHFRKNKSGVIINVASMAGRLAFPYHSLYHGTKWAVDGFSESLRFELEPFGIKVKIIEPGAIKTDFYDRSNDNTVSASPSDYKELCELAFKNMKSAEEGAISPVAVAKSIYRAASDGSNKLRYVVGPDAKSFLFLRNFLPDGVYAGLVKMSVFKGSK
ncbi:SDR family oxidoreductase [Leptospira idonii]|uniref:SDR family oxidoreductase n=1 Tax=Leptospira idonii TaxID=1193500 RepID=A0A4R9LWM2_9LEPT|nr:SDR family oxidoreductase [Leptospira idonii]TGN17269.1 SDR family oxidoreductase [Leptospira idonii]